MQMITPNISVAGNYETPIQHPICLHLSSLVCSTIEDFDFMFGCINAGASEYLIKPLRADVIRTLPLVTISSNTTRSTRLTALLLFRNCTDISLQHCYIIV